MMNETVESNQNEWINSSIDFWMRMARYGVWVAVLFFHYT